MSTANHCSKCSTNVGTCNCAGCKDYFCTKHFITHRKELQTSLEQIIDTPNRLIKQFNENDHSISLKTALLNQIDQWQNEIIQKVHQTADNIRQQVTQVLNSQREETKKKFQELVDELQKRREEDDFVEDDLVRLKNRAHQLQQELEQLQQHSDLGLHIEKSDGVDWAHLIYIESKSTDNKKRKNLQVKSDTKTHQGFDDHAQSTYSLKTKCGTHSYKIYSSILSQSLFEIWKTDLIMESKITRCCSIIQVIFLRWDRLCQWQRQAKM
ncbi:unnamed protein product [Rotaria magnacalcarata]